MKGAGGFEQYYGELYGGRWPSLRHALLAEGSSVSLTVGDTPAYYMDPASVIPALALGAEEGHDALDLCAAPGGKTLLLAGMLGGHGSLIANDRSAARRARLHRVLDGHLPPEYRRSVTVTGHDASRWGLYHPGEYDRVLADVPCSSERHVLNAKAELEKWSSSRTRRLAQGAYAIACAAADSLRDGGVLVYSTCSLSERENDGVVGRVLERAGGSLEAVRTDACSRLTALSAPEATARFGATTIEATVPITLTSEPTRFGELILPDTGGFGPIYFAVIRRTACISR